MTVILNDLSGGRAARMSKRAAEGRVTWRHRVHAYVVASYGHDSKPLCVEDIRAALNGKTNVVKNAITALIVDGHLRVVGFAPHADRLDLPKSAKMYAPTSAPLLPAYVTANDEIAAAMKAKARSGSDKRYLLNTEPPVRAYVGKPPALSPPRAKAAPYRGEVGHIYQRTWKPLEPSLADDWRDVAKLRMMAR